MTQSPIDPQDPRRSDDDRSAAGPLRPLEFDEMVALFVAFLSLGGVLFWGLTRGNMNLFGGESSVAGNSSISAPALEGALGETDAATSADVEDDAEADAAALGSSAVVATAPEGSARRELAERAAERRERLAARKPIWQDVRDGMVGAAAGIAGGAAITADDATAEETPTETVAETPTETAAETTTAEESPAESSEEAETTESDVPDTVAATPSEAATAEPQEALAFTDVPDDYWAKPYIDALSSRGLISGYSDNTFRPDEPVTRAQIANVVANTFDLTADKEDLAFSDVAGDYWAKESIGEAVKGGFMTGFPDETFAPNEPVTRAQSFTTLVTGLGVDVPTNIQAALSRYTDANAIPRWANEKIAAATAGGLVVNYPNEAELNPAAPTTRAELSAMIYQALEREGIVEAIESEYIVKP
ncbi:MAG: S-layer homology domain-containing protein [Cyanobacteria bacterium J06632_3]